MNYFAHGRRYIEQPYYLAGTALPDWLSVADRATRFRTQHVAPFADGSDAPAAHLAAGVLQHLHDDASFHASPAFYTVSGRLTGMFRDALPADDGYRPSLLGHIVTELLLDAVLIDAEPARLDAYYRAIDHVDARLVEAAVNRMARRPTARLAAFIPLFSRERFLADYRIPERLVFRLNQVLRRVKLSPLPDDIARVLPAAREIVEAQAGELLAFQGSATQIPLPRKDRLP